MNKGIFIPTDYSRLNKVIVKSPGNESRHVHLFEPSINFPGFTTDIIGKHAYKEHHAFVKLLQENNIETLNLNDLVDTAIKHASQSKNFDIFLSQFYPRLAILSKKQKKQLKADDLIGANSQTFYPSKPGFAPYNTHSLQWMYYTRDIAVTLPQGVVLTNFGHKSRALETSITRFMFQNAPELNKYPIIFDAEQEDIRMQGGDLIVLNDTTLLMGVNNLSSIESARKLAQQIGINVIAVNMPSGPTQISNSWTKLNSYFLHLDSIFNLLDSHRALVLPYFLQNEFDKDNPFYRILESIQKEPLSQAEQHNLNKLKETIKNFGLVTLYEGRTGKKTETKMKIVNFLQQYYHFEFIFVGGSPKKSTIEQVQHLTEIVFPEIRFQGANILALKPNHIVMYENDTEETQKTLIESGIKVKLFDGHELVRWNGGPHCMTLPISRLNQ